MKAIKFILLLFIIIITSCTNEEPNLSIQGSVSMSINNEKFSPNTYILGNFTENKDYIMMTTGSNRVKSRIIGGKKHTLDKHFKIWGYVSKINTIYQLSLFPAFTKDGDVIAEYTETWNNEAGDFVESINYRAVGGKLIFTQLNEKKVEGTFEFEAQSLNGDNKTVNITGGKFSFVPKKQ